MAITTQLFTQQATAWPFRSLLAWLLSGLLVLWMLMLTGCAGLPPLDGRISSAALPDTAGTPIGKALAPLLAQHPGLTGIAALDDGRLAFGTRVRLAQAASRSIDVQTYIWNDDATGSLLFEEMLRAAERGVRVRLLLDDANTGGRDPLLALLATQPNLELRLYNPFVYRGSKALGFLGDFSRLNHRMHNKSFTVDNQVAVVGGRNLADEYFEAAGETNFADLDVIAVGAAVREVSAEFDLYWNSASAYPAPLLLAGVPAMPRQQLADRVDAFRASAAGAAYSQAIQNTPQVQRLLAGQLALEWTPAQVLSDDPAKTLRADTDVALLMLPRLTASLGQASRSLDLVSPYFVPGDEGTAQLVALAQRACGCGC